MKYPVGIPILCVLLCISFFLSGCEASKTEHTKRGSVQSENAEETTLSENVYTLTYLPVQQNVRQRDYRILDGEIIVFETLRFLNPNSTVMITSAFDFRGNRKSTRDFERPSFDVIRLLPDGTICAACCENGELIHTAERADGSVIAASEPVPAEYGPRTAMLPCGDYFVSYALNDLWVLDSSLSCVCTVPFPYPEYADTLTAVRMADADTLLLQFDENQVGAHHMATHRHTVYELHPSDGSLKKREAEKPETQPGEILRGPVGAEDGYRLSTGGISYSENGETRRIVDFSASYLNADRIRVFGVFRTKEGKEGFLVEYTDAVTELTQPALLPAENAVSSVQTVTMTSIGVSEQEGYAWLTDAVNTFNRSQSAYRVQYDAYGVTTGQGTLSEAERDIINGKHYDIYLFGYHPLDRGAEELYEALSEKRVFSDLSALASECGVFPSVIDAFQSRGRTDALPLTLFYDTLVCLPDTLPPGADFSFEAMNTLMDACTSEIYFTAFERDYDKLFDAGLSLFFDAERAECDFSSEEFLSFLDRMERLRTACIPAYRDFVEQRLGFPEFLLSDGTMPSVSRKTGYPACFRRKWSRFGISAVN